VISWFQTFPFSNGSTCTATPRDVRRARRGRDAAVHRLRRGRPGGGGAVEVQGGGQDGTGAYIISYCLHYLTAYIISCCSHHLLLLTLFLATAEPTTLPPRSYTSNVFILKSRNKQAQTNKLWESEETSESEHVILHEFVKSLVRRGAWYGTTRACRKKQSARMPSSWTYC
jgi:hypothetical protein